MRIATALLYLTAKDRRQALSSKADGGPVSVEAVAPRYDCWDGVHLLIDVEVPREAFEHSFILFILDLMGGAALLSDQISPAAAIALPPHMNMIATFG